MKKYPTGKVTLLTLLISLACFPCASLANDDDEILKLFNDTARSLPAASAGTAPSREEILSAQLKTWQKENRKLQKRIAQLETLKAEAEKKESLFRTSEETDRLLEKLKDEIRINKQTIARQALALKAADAKNNGQEADLKITNLTQQLHETEKQLVQLRQEKQGAVAELKQQAERQKALQGLQAKLDSTEKQLAQLQ
uniref:hypothetical protein n=1 Tax=Pantoea sp. TaxID=69393 RepID=UPI0028967F2B